MNTLIFKSGKKVDCLSVMGAVKFAKGAEKDCLTFNFNADNITANEVMALFSDKDETSEIIICSDNYSNTENKAEDNITDSGGFLYSDYTLFIGLEIKEETIQSENNSSSEKAVTVISITMGQMNFSEKLEQEKNKQLKNLSEVFADILGGAL